MTAFRVLNLIGTKIKTTGSVSGFNATPSGGHLMPYETFSDLPPAIRRLPRHAQEIFRAAFNAAWQSYADRGTKAREEIAHRVAWAAVKKRYRKSGERWVPA